VIAPTVGGFLPKNWRLVAGVFSAQLMAWVVVFHLPPGDFPRTVESIRRRIGANPEY
jgi:hypothetical protein